MKNKKKKNGKYSTSMKVSNTRNQRQRLDSEVFFTIVMKKSQRGKRADQMKKEYYHTMGLIAFQGLVISREVMDEQASRLGLLYCKTKFGRF